jgi:DNA-binding CsgD family transcriptional regulator
VPRSNTRASKQILARIQRLCCLGIGGEMLMPELIREVMGLIPARIGSFWWLGGHFEITNMWSTFPQWFKDLWCKEFYDTNRELEAFRPFNEQMKLPAPGNIQLLAHMLSVDYRDFLQSDWHNLLLRPAEVQDYMRLMVREAGHLRGLLYVYRTGGEPQFSPDDARMLGAMAGFVAHGLTPATLMEDGFADSDDRALLVADHNGVVRHADGQAQHLLMMALNPCISPATNWRGLREAIPEIAELCHRLSATARGRLGQPPPVLRLPTQWGEFVLRAYWFEPTDGVEQTRHIGITIERRVPRAVALLRRVEDLALTSREKQLCLLLARNQPGLDLADTMGLAASTVITHQRRIYAKLGVHSRAGLLAALHPA